MKKSITILSLLILGCALAGSASAATPNWDVTGTWKWLVLGTYEHDMVLSQNPDGTFSGTGGYPAGSSPYTDPGQTSEVITNGVVDGDTVTFTTTYDGPYNPGYSVTVSGTIASDGTMSGNSPWEWHTTGGSATFNRYAEIVKPEENEIVFGNLPLGAFLFDNEEDPVQWAVRKGTCAAGTNTVLGNVDGHTDSLTMSYDGTYTYTYAGSFDITGFDGGMYCFIFNPKEDAGETDIRLTRQFYIAEGGIHGGGQIIEEKGGKPKDDLKISFGGYAWDIGSEGYVGEWQINFHNVGQDNLDKATFHANEVQAMNFYTGTGTCDEAMNMTLVGTLNGEEGWKVIFRAGDLGEGRCGYEDFVDTVRVELYEGSAKRYDTNGGDFSPESNCVGTSRTGLDSGNVTIEF